MPRLRDFVLLDMDGLSALYWATRGGHEGLVGSDPTGEGK